MNYNISREIRWLGGYSPDKPPWVNSVVCRYNSPRLGPPAPAVSLGAVRRLRRRWSAVSAAAAAALAMERSAAGFWYLGLRGGFPVWEMRQQAGGVLKIAVPPKKNCGVLWWVFQCLGLHIQPGHIGFHGSAKDALGVGFWYSLLNSPPKWFRKRVWFLPLTPRSRQHIETGLRTFSLAKHTPDQKNRNMECLGPCLNAQALTLKRRREKRNHPCSGYLGLMCRGTKKQSMLEIVGGTLKQSTTNI